MSRYAVVAGGAVDNVILLDDESGWTPPEGSALVALPDDSPVSIGYAYDGTNFTAPAAPAPPVNKQALADAIDDLVADIYANWTRFQQAYINRENAAQAFKDAGYTGDPGVWVTGFAQPAGMTNQAAADLILSQANMLNTALANLDAQRMRKYEVFSAADADATGIYNDIVAKISAIAATLS